MGAGVCWQLHSIDPDHSFCVETADKVSAEKTVTIYFGHVRSGYGWTSQEGSFYGRDAGGNEGRPDFGFFFRDIIKKDMHSIRGALIPS